MPLDTAPDIEAAGQSAVAERPLPKARSDAPFVAGLCIIGGFYVLFIAAMVLADMAYTTPGRMKLALQSPAIRYSIRLSLLSCTLSTIFSLWVAVPLGYMLSRYQAPAGRSGWWAWLFKGVVDAVLDIPIVLPPLVVGLSLLILFHTAAGRQIERVFPVTYAIPSVIVAQFAVACAFAVRTMKVSFDQINPRSEQVALTLGCSRSQAFWMVVLPEARHGMLAAGTLAWARALGEFGPILVFSGATRFRTEVLPTSVYLEVSVGNLESAVAVSLLMIAVAVLVLVVVRLSGADTAVGRAGT